VLFRVGLLSEKTPLNIATLSLLYFFSSLRASIFLNPSLFIFAMIRIFLPD